VLSLSLFEKMSQVSGILRLTVLVITEVKHLGSSGRFHLEHYLALEKDRAMRLGSYAAPKIICVSMMTLKC
jgi:hypothetical protein